MSEFQTVAVPFTKLGNRQVLLDSQIIEMPWLKEFIGRFPKCFERDHVYAVWVYYPDGDAP